MRLQLRADRRGSCEQPPRLRQDDEDQPHYGAACHSPQERQDCAIERLSNRVVAAPIVLTTPSTEEAVPSMAAMRSIARVLKFDDAKEKQTMVSACRMMNAGRLS